MGPAPVFSGVSFGVIALVLLLLLGIAVLVLLIRKPMIGFFCLCLLLIVLSLKLIQPIPSPLSSPNLSVQSGSTRVEISGSEVNVNALASALDPDVLPESLAGYTLKLGQPLWKENSWQIEPNPQPIWQGEQLVLPVTVTTWGSAQTPLPAWEDDAPAEYEQGLRSLALAHATDQMALYLRDLAKRSPLEHRELTKKLQLLMYPSQYEALARELCATSISKASPDTVRIERHPPADDVVDSGPADSYVLHITVPRRYILAALPSARVTYHETRSRQTWLGSAVMALGVLGLAYVVLKLSTRRACGRHT
ncbi:MAG: hypothetical protein ABIG44_15265 [Planctomycetota bacterium]